MCFLYISGKRRNYFCSSLYKQQPRNSTVFIIKWSGEGIPLDLKRKKQAEFLIKGDVSREMIAGFICYNEKVRNELIALGADGSKIKVSSLAYY